jgi:YHS domain-containing protein
MIINRLTELYESRGLAGRAHCAAQPIEITQFRLTGAFVLAYTRLAASHRSREVVGPSSQEEMAQTSAATVMGFFGLIRFVFWVLMVSWVIKLLGRLFSGTSQAERGRSSARAEHPAAPSKRLVKDPVCGMHLAEELSLPMSANGETQYFCSQECRSKYENSVLRRAASA